MTNDTQKRRQEIEALLKNPGLHQKTRDNYAFLLSQLQLQDELLKEAERLIIEVCKFDDEPGSEWKFLLNRIRSHLSV